MCISRAFGGRCESLSSPASLRVRVAGGALSALATAEAKLAARDARLHEFAQREVKCAARGACARRAVQALLRRRDAVVLFKTASLCVFLAQEPLLSPVSSNESTRGSRAREQPLCEESPLSLSATRPLWRFGPRSGVWDSSADPRVLEKPPRCAPLTFLEPASEPQRNSQRTAGGARGAESGGAGDAARGGAGARGAESGGARARGAESGGAGARVAAALEGDRGHSGGFSRTPFPNTTTSVVADTTTRHTSSGGRVGGDSRARVEHVRRRASVVARGSQ